MAAAEVHLSRARGSSGLPNTAGSVRQLYERGNDEAHIDEARSRALRLSSVPFADGEQSGSLRLEPSRGALAWTDPVRCTCAGEQ